MSAAEAVNTTAEWQPIETAPKDGTLIILRNKLMAEGADRQLAAGIEARWGEYRSQATGRIYINWHTPWGHLVCPDEWKPVRSDADCGDAR